MHLVQHPRPDTQADEEYNRDVADDGFRRGDFNLYFDVYEDGLWLFSSYNHSESVNQWRSRMDADDWPDKRVPFIRFGLFDAPIPLSDPEARTLSLTCVSDIINANFRIALNGREASDSVVWTTANNIRQLLYYHGNSWAVRWLVDNEHGLTLRAVVAHKGIKDFDTTLQKEA